jgi:predicted dehydrogenase
MKNYRVGMIGFGFIGKVHAYGYVNLPLFYEALPARGKITHVCTSREDTARAGAAMVGAEHAVTDWRRITENPDVDIVHICTPNHLHVEPLLSAMAHGKHIYCDKPLTATLDEARQVERALADYRGISQMTLQNRFFPATMRAKQLVEAGFLGQVLQFRAAYLHAGSADPKAPLKWKLSAAAGGGAIADLGSHVLDLVGHLLGDYESVLACTKIAYPQRPSVEDPKRLVDVDAEDAMIVMAKMAGGAVGVVEATKLATGAEDEIRLEIHGSRGALRFNGMDPHHLMTYDASAPDKPIGGDRGWRAIDMGQRYPAPASAFPSPKNVIGWMRGHLACLANFLQAIAENRPAQPDLAYGVRLQGLLDTVARSAKGGQWLSV